MVVALCADVSIWRILKLRLGTSWWSLQASVENTSDKRQPVSALSV